MNTDIKTCDLGKKIPLTLIELFSGIGAQKRGIDMTRLFDCEVIATSDIDKEAIVSYAAIHKDLTPEMVTGYEHYPSEDDMKKELLEKNIGYDFKKKTNPIAKVKGVNLKKFWLAMKLGNNLGDISKLESLPMSDMWTYSFCCQDISIAGKQAGIVKGETRSGLLYEVERLLETAVVNGTQPKYLLLENVKNLVGKRFKGQFNEWVAKLETLGYNTYFQVINGKNCGVPQNRERVFAISIRKDIDTNSYEFPKPFDNGVRLKDILDNEVEEKYYLSSKALKNFTPYKKQKGVDIKTGGTLNPDKQIQDRVRVLDTNGISQSLRATDYKDPVKIIKIGELNSSRDGVVISPAGITKTHVAGHNNIPKTLCGESLNTGSDCLKISNHDNDVIRIRKLTPLECFRLMGFRDEDIMKCQNLGISNSSLYKQSGNSIITNCIMLLIGHLYKAQFDNTYECFDENFTRPQVD